MAEAEPALVGESAGDQRGVEAAAQARPVADRADTARKLDPLDQDRRRIMQWRIHQVGAAGGDHLIIDPDIQPRPEQSAILELAGQGAIGNRRSARQPGKEMGCVRRGDDRLFLRVELIARRALQARRADRDDVGQRVVCGLGKCRRGHEGQASGQGEKGAAVLQGETGHVNAPGRTPATAGRAVDSEG